MNTVTLKNFLLKNVMPGLAFICLMMPAAWAQKRVKFPSPLGRASHATVDFYAVFGLYVPGMELIEGAQGVTDWSGELPATKD